MLFKFDDLVLLMKNWRKASEVADIFPIPTIPVILVTDAQDEALPRTWTPRHKGGNTKGIYSVHGENNVVFLSVYPQEGSIKLGISANNYLMISH